VVIHIEPPTSGFSIADVGPIIAGLSFLLAAWAFHRNSRYSEFQYCNKLSEQIDEKWAVLKKQKRLASYNEKLTDLLNHYERCAMLLNEVRFLPGRAARNLRIQVIECLEQNWNEEYFQERFQAAISSKDTFCELKELMRRSGKFSNRAST